MKCTALLFGSHLALLGLAGCGGATPESTTPESAPATVAESPSAEPAQDPSAASAPAVWSDDLTPEQKGAFMVEHIMPAMAPVFAQAPDFTCKTCHGPEQVDAKAFAHPNAYLPRLTFKDGKITSFETHPEVSMFMANKVLPAMAMAMGKELYSPENPNGMGCNGCHAVDMQ